MYTSSLYASPDSPLGKTYTWIRSSGPSISPLKSNRILTKITPSDSAIYENVEFCIFCQKTDHGCMFICLCFFFPGVIVSTPWSENVAKGLIPMEIKSSSALFK